MIYGFVMAAGASRRFGDIKQLAKIDGVSMALRSYIRVKCQIYSERFSGSKYNLQQTVEYGIRILNILCCN